MTSRDLISRLQADAMFAGIDLAREMEPSRYIGRSAEQVLEFVTQEVEPIRKRYVTVLGQTGEVTV
jgi:adenylosuccinate lyase